MKREYTYLHPYAYAMILNIIYCIDTNKPLKSALEAKYFVEKRFMKRNISYNFKEFVDKDYKGNTQYLRYWHGSMVIVKLLLLFMDLGKIYILNSIVLGLLLIILLARLIKKKLIGLTIAFIIGIIMTTSFLVPLCLEYSWTFCIMLITSILATIWYDNKRKLNILFFLTGMITCFFDFLTTEIITILMPILIVLLLQVKYGKITTAKQAIVFIIQSILLWGISYVAMWFAKWIITSIVLNINAFDYVIKQGKERAIGKVAGIESYELPGKAVIRNICTLFPINNVQQIEKLYIVPVIIILLETLIIRKKDLKKLWISGVLLIIAIIPYIRYMILPNHSYLHYFFTFRSQIITITAIILAILYSIDIEFWKNKIKKHKKQE